MQPHIRAVIAATVYAIIKREKVAGIYDHAAGRHLKIAAECRDNRVQAFDGDRLTHFDGELPNLYDHGTGAFVTVNVTGMAADGYDHASGTFFTARVGEGLIEVYDHGEGAWFAYNS